MFCNDLNKKAKMRSENYLLSLFLDLVIGLVLIFLQNIIFTPSKTRRIFKNVIFIRMGQTLNIELIL